MKKLLAVLLAMLMLVTLTACGNKTTTEETTTDEVSEDVVVDEPVTMSYAEYDAAEIGTLCTVKAYVQAHQSWWDNSITLYLADKDGAYFAYNVYCDEETAAKLVPGTEIMITGVKSEYAGEIEFGEDEEGNAPTFEFVDGSDTYIAEAVDVTSLLGTDELIAHQNQKVLFTDMTVVSVAYKNDEPGDDIYLTLSKDGADYEFCLEYYLNGDDTEFYDLVGSLTTGQVVDVEGFLYWYNGANPHITSVTVK